MGLASTTTYLRIHALRDYTPRRLLCERRRVRLSHKPRPDHFSVLRIRHGDNRSLPNLGMCSQDVLYLHREQVLMGREISHSAQLERVPAYLSPADDDVLDSADD